MNIEDMVGKVFDHWTQIDDEELHFVLPNGDYFKFHHYQDCCEDVRIEDICGDLEDLIGSPIILAEKRTMEGSDSDSSEWPVGVEKERWLESYTWTFYEIATNKGSVTIRWYGSSNGYYSESVDLNFVKKEVENEPASK